MVLFMVKGISGFILDLDGVFFKNFIPLEGAKKFINTIAKQGKPFVFLSNLTTKTPTELQSLLLQMGIFIEAGNIITPSVLTKEYLKQYYPDSNIKVFGSNALKSSLYQNYKVGVNDDLVDVLIIGMEPKISIADLSSMRQMIHKGKKVIFTNPDYYAPTTDGYNFECGVMIEIFRPHLKEKPFIIGKPSSFAFKYAIDKLGIPKEKVAMVGDTYETDIKGAIDAGLIPIHIQTTKDQSYNTMKLEALEFTSLQELTDELLKNL